MAPYEWLGHRLSHVEVEPRTASSCLLFLLTSRRHCKIILHPISLSSDTLRRIIPHGPSLRQFSIYDGAAQWPWQQGPARASSVREKLQHAVHDVMLQRLWYESVGYEMDGVESAPPDSMCLMWHNTETAWKFGCRYLQVSMLSMRGSSHSTMRRRRHFVQWETFPVDYLIGVL